MKKKMGSLRTKLSEEHCPLVILSDEHKVNLLCTSMRDNVALPCIGQWGS